jgi:DNA repair protein RadC
MATKTLEMISLKKDPTNFERVKITSSDVSANYIRQFYGDDLEIFESFFILLLNRQNKTIGYAKISQGGVAGTVVDAKIIIKYIVDTFASAVILCHNHPSGNLNPSTQDLEITKKLAQAAKLVDSQVLDHIILTPDSFYSFADNGLI